MPQDGVVARASEPGWNESKSRALVDRPCAARLAHNHYLATMSAAVPTPLQGDRQKNYRIQIVGNSGTHIPKRHIGSMFTGHFPQGRERFDHVSTCALAGLTCRRLRSGSEWPWY